MLIARPHRGRRAHGVRGHTTQRRFRLLRLDGEVRTVEASHALALSASMLPLRELVVAIDHFRARPGNPMLDVESLSAHRGPGAGRLNRAISLSRTGAESRMETATRLMLEAFGIAEGFELQVGISDRRGRIGRFDLVHRAKRLIIEYDGEQHRLDRGQYLRDEFRLDRVREVGFRVIRLRYEDIERSPYATVTRIAGALGRSPARVEGSKDLLAPEGPAPKPEFPGTDGVTPEPRALRMWAPNRR